MTKWTALLLAGSRPTGDPLARAMGASHKALIPIDGEPMILRPLKALLESPNVGEIIILTQNSDDLRGVIPKSKRVRFEASRSTIAETMEDLIVKQRVQFPVLVTTADHALLDPQMIAEFTAAAAGADLAVGVVERKNLLERLPQAKRTWIPFRRGAYSGANLFAFGSIKVLAPIEQWRSVEQSRKSGLRLLSALGPTLLLGAALRMRTLDQSVAAVGRKFKMTIRAVVMSNPLACVDVDKPVDHAVVEAILNGRA